MMTIMIGKATRSLSKFLTAALLFSALPGLAFAETMTTKTYSRRECTAVNLARQFPRPKNQGDAEWCFAFAAADLLSFELKRDISPLDLAISSNLYESVVLKGPVFPTGYRPPRGKPDPFRDDGGIAFLAPEVLRQGGGACDEEKFPVLANVPAKIQFYDLLALLKKTGRAKVKWPTSPTSPKFKYQLSKLSDSGLLSKLFPALSSGQLAEALRGETGAERFLTARELACQPRIPIPIDLLFDRERNSLKNSSDGIYEKSSSARMMTELDHQRPILISYDAKLFAWSNLPFLRGSHASTVIGRRWNDFTNDCEVLIRNSWGIKSCQNLWPQLSCEDGNPWISLKKLENEIYATVVIRRGS